MSPSSGQVLVPKAFKAFKYMVSKGAAYLRARLAQGAAKSLEPIPLRLSRQPLHPVAALRQRAQQRNLSTAVRRIISGVARPVQAARPAAGHTIRSALSKTHLAPFSSPLRPNLTGGAIPRSSGGYSLGGNGIRHFSSTPASQAHVVQNVSAAIRAFCINGYKAQYDGTDSRGLSKFRSVSGVQGKALANMRNSKPFVKGTTLEFRIAPTITAIPAVNAEETTLESEEVLPGLASDFARSLSCLAMVHADIKKLATLGSLPITYPNPHTLHVRFPGCDASIVYALCDDLGIQRGIVREDPEWDPTDGDQDVDMALLFPWAPSHAPTEDLFGPVYVVQQSEQKLDWQDTLSKHTLESLQDPSDHEYSVVAPPDESFSSPWQIPSSTPSLDVLGDSDIESNEELNFGMDLARTEILRPSTTVTYEGMEGVLRFLQQCDDAVR